jgi:hypothetical protein
MFARLPLLLHLLRLTAKARTNFPGARIRRDATVRMASTLPRLPIFDAIAGHDARSTAVIHSLSNRRFTYGELLRDVAEAKESLRESANGLSLEGQRIAFLVENSYDYVGAGIPLDYQMGSSLITHSNFAFNHGQPFNRTPFIL